MNIQIHFLGASGTVTGSKFLLQSEKFCLLIDCGLFQGKKELRNLNWGPLPVAAKDIDAVLLTHGHLDHTGYLPVLVRNGFKGPVYGTNPTLDISKIILYDSARIQENEAERANQEGYSKHHPAKPLYTVQEVETSTRLFKGLPPSRWIQVVPEVKARFQYNGHIIGSTFIELDILHKRFVFSGDVGRLHDLLLFKPLRPKKADFLFMESTYGARFHPEEKDTIPAIASIINETVARGGSLFIPSFSVGRSQLLMYILWQLSKEKKIPEIPMIIDSPMGLSVLELLYRSRDWHKLDENEFIEMCRNFKIVDNFKETLDWREDEKSKIVIAGSGMMTGGRILNYLETNSADPKNTLLFVGYQAEETRGRKILEGAREVKVYGKTLPFRMQVEEIEGLSAHADQLELLNWVKDIKNKPENVFLIHGEAESSIAMQRALLEKYTWESEIPDLFSIKSIVL